jgi:peroxiredoxin
VKKCPACGVPVKVENLERHVRNQHPNESVDLETILTSEERRAAHGTSAVRPAVTTRGLAVIVVVVLVVALLFAIVVLNPFRGTGPGVGQFAPGFTLTASNGGEVTLSDYRGKPVLVEFMDVDCEYCVREAQDVLRLVYETYGSSVEFLSVSVDFVGQPDTMDRLNGFRTTYGTPWTYVLDAQGEVRGAYGVYSTPTTFFLDRDGVVAHMIRGAAPGGIDTYAQQLDRLLRT